MINKSAVLIQREGKTIKSFPMWTKPDKNRAKVKIVFKDGKKKRVIVCIFKGSKSKPAICMCAEAVIKNWPSFDPQEHDIVISAGHIHSLGNKKAANP